MLYKDHYDLMREHYSICVNPAYNKNTLFFSKLASYSFSDRMYQWPKICKTNGYFEVLKDSDTINEDVLMLLVKLQHNEEVRSVVSPCGSIKSTWKRYKDKEITHPNNQEYKDVLSAIKDWQTPNYTNNVISTSLGGYTLVHHMYNTEVYKNAGVKKAKKDKINFKQFVMLPSGLKFAWLLHQFDWSPDQPIVLYDISSFPICFAKEMIIDWDGIEPLHDWALNHPIAKSILIASGQINEGVRPGAGPKDWDTMWQREIDLWGGLENITKTIKKLKEAEEKGNISWCTINMVNDNKSQSLIFDNLKSDESTLFWLSNVFDSSSVASTIASNKTHLYDVEYRTKELTWLYNNLKNKLPKPCLVLGSIPINRPSVKKDFSWTGYEYLQAQDQ